MHAQNYLPCLIEFTLVFNSFINSYRILYNIFDQIHSHPFPSSFQVNSLSPLCILFFVFSLRRDCFSICPFCLALTILPPFFCNVPWALRSGGPCVVNTLTGGEHPLVGWSRHFDLFWFSMMISVYCKRSMRIRGEPGTYLQGQDKVLAHRHHSGLGNISSPLGATAHQPQGAA